jgi:hypothetical protein
LSDREPPELVSLGEAQSLLKIASRRSRLV